MCDDVSKCQCHELATVIDKFLATLNAKRKLPVHTLRTLDALSKCRTEYMGGHIEACQECGCVRIAFNSCRNRHCPKCGSIDKEKWIMKRELDLLPVKYFHACVPEYRHYGMQACRIYGPQQAQRIVPAPQTPDIQLAFHNGLGCDERFWQ